MLKQHILDIFYAITAIRKVQHIKPSCEKIYQYLHKINKDAEKSLIISTIENLVRNGYLKVEGEGENESIFILKSFEDFFNYLLIEYSKIILTIKIVLYPMKSRNLKILSIQLRREIMALSANPPYKPIIMVCFTKE